MRKGSLLNLNTARLPLDETGLVEVQTAGHFVAVCVRVILRTVVTFGTLTSRYFLASYSRGSSSGVHLL